MKNQVQNHLSKLSSEGAGQLYDLFYTLGYEFQDEDLTFRTNQWTEKQRLLVKKVTLLASHNGFRVFWVRMKNDELLRTSERIIINKLTGEYPYNMIVFSNANDRQWDFVNMKLAKEEEAKENKNPRKRQILRRIRIDTSERLRTAIERITLLAVPESGASSLELQKRHDEAFDVEAVSEEFFKQFQIIFSRLRNNLAEQTGNREWAHASTLQFLNRLMFLYFIQKKKWLGGDEEFIRSYWQAYQESGQQENSFVDKWLAVLFFEAFNKKLSHPRWLPDQYRQVLQMVPYLNGGLFKRNKYDTNYHILITDKQFKEVFDFLQHYNFTITEDSPIDREVAVDPEMIGKVYESLVNVSDEIDERGEAGIFYTPRTEITLMCRLALVDRLTNEFGEEHKNRFYELLFAFLEEDKDMADDALAEVNLWPDMSRFLRELTVVDPAVGSGSFLVGMLTILTDLTKRANKQLGLQELDFDIKKRLIGQSLYGVDVMEWAVHVCELRLWLQLVVETDMKPEELTLQPLLPNLSFKIRTGDSVVQEVGGINMTHLHLSGLPPDIKGKITRLKGEKLKYFNNDPTARFKSQKAIEQEELNLFREILNRQIKDQDDRLFTIKRALAEQGEQKDLFGGDKPRQLSALKKTYQKEIKEITVKRERLLEARKALKGRENIPFVWDISFVEIFEVEELGFDIVVGNPPYVRSHDIANPYESSEDFGGESSDTWKKTKKNYKTKLMNSVYRTYPHFFRYREDDQKARRKLNGKNDLYVYFYFHGLSLLNEKGSFCFVTSNSWLDVGYGKDLQEFLIKIVPVKLIIDNQVKRTFKSADVNTVICLFGAPNNGDKPPLSKEQFAKFVMFYVPFESVLDPIIFEEVEEARDRTTKPEYRVVPKSKDELFENGLDKKRAKAKRIDAYVGDKWGGKYLRAPDIYYTIMEKIQNKFVRLGGLANVNEGKPTGANDFFYVKKEIAKAFEIEEEYLHNGIMRTKGFGYFTISSSLIDRYFLSVNKSINEIKNDKVFNYIKYGESKGIHLRKTFISKSEWWRFNIRPYADLLMPCGIGNRFFCAKNRAKAISSNSFTEIRFSNKKLVSTVWIYLNSVIGILLLEIIGRSSLGGGLLKTDPIEYRELLVPREQFNYIPDLRREVYSIFEEIGLNNNQQLYLQEPNPLPDRKALDDIVFDAIGLTEAERKEVYWAVCELVQRRLEKARSV